MSVTATIVILLVIGVSGLLFTGLFMCKNTANREENQQNPLDESEELAAPDPR